jgi:hypothetical protein
MIDAKLRDIEIRKMENAMKILIDLNAVDTFDCRDFKNLIDHIQSHVSLTKEE